MSKKSKNIILNFIGISPLLLLISLLWINACFSFTNAYLQEATISKKIQLIPHSPFTITSDLDFETYGFPGNGLQNNPYIIENYEIISSAVKGISISDTTKFFVIRNCYVDVLTSGIYLSNVAKGTSTITNNTCTNNVVGIELRSSSSDIINNTCTLNTEYGIQVDSSPSLVKNNTCFSNGAYGIYLWNSSDSLIVENTCNNNNMRGIYLQDNQNSTISDNICYYNTQWGIYLVHSHHNTLTKNLCNFNYDKGMYFWGSDNCNITDSSFEANGGYGIDLDSNSDSNIVCNNNFLDNIVSASQARDDGSNNYWYNITSLSGNFWSDWYSGSYSIDGFSSSVDMYPLNDPVIFPEYSLKLSFLMVFLISLSLATICYSKKKLKS